jgi:hypothetical protein
MSGGFIQRDNPYYPLRTPKLHYWDADKMSYREPKSDAEKMSVLEDAVIDLWKRLEALEASRPSP